MKRLFAPVLFLLALAQALHAEVQAIDSKIIQETTGNKINMENADDSIGGLVAGYHEKRRQSAKQKKEETTKDQREENKELLKESIRELKDDIRELEKEYGLMKKVLEEELEGLLSISRQTRWHTVTAPCARLTGHGLLEIMSIVLVATSAMTLILMCVKFLAVSPVRF